MGLPQIITIIQDYIGNLCIESPGFGGSPHFPPYESPWKNESPARSCAPCAALSRMIRASSSRWHDGQSLVLGGWGLDGCEILR